MRILIWTENTGITRFTVTQDEDTFNTILARLKRYNIVPIIEPYSYERIIQLAYL